MIVAFFISTVLTAMVVGLAIAITRRRAREVCDLSRSVVIVGPKANHEACVSQRRTLKPLIHQARRNGYNIIELYGREIVVRNGKPLTTITNPHLRSRLRISSGFATVCLGEDADRVITSRDPLAEPVLASFFGVTLPEGPRTLGHAPVGSTAPGTTAFAEGRETAPSEAEEDDPRVIRRRRRPRDGRVREEPEPPGTSWGRVGVLR